MNGWFLYSVSCDQLCDLPGGLIGGTGLPALLRNVERGALFGSGGKCIAGVSCEFDRFVKGYITVKSMIFINVSVQICDSMCYGYVKILREDCSKMCGGTHLVILLYSQTERCVCHRSGDGRTERHSFGFTLKDAEFGCRSDREFEHRLSHLY